MNEQQIVYCNPQDELDEELTIDLKKIFFTLWSRKVIVAKVVTSVLIFFILLTFITPRKYQVDADIYINKSNNSNLAEFNPYVISELGAGGGMAALMSGGNSALTNELELMKSPLVMDKVIRENDIKYGKRWGIIPTKKTGKYIEAEKFAKRVAIENKKGTNVVSISYKSKKRELAYDVVNSIIANYIELHKQLNSEKSKADKKLLEEEYIKAKASLNEKINQTGGIPETALNSSGGLSAMSAFSSSASRALSSLKGQMISGAKSKVEITEESTKVAELAKKLEWARLVDEMSDSSKVLVIKEPRQLQKYEYASPKLFTNIILGFVFGLIASLFTVLLLEVIDKKLTYSMLGDKIIYDLDKDFIDLQVEFLSKKNTSIGVVVFENLSSEVISKLQNFKNLKFIKAEISEEFIENIKTVDDIINIAEIGKTDSKLYKHIKQLITNSNKSIVKEILL